MKSSKRSKHSTSKVKHLTDVLSELATMVIVMQDYPDPDAIASAVALRELANHIGGVRCSIAHGGFVGRAENRALVRYLDINLHSVDEIDWETFDAIALVDTQPGTGNNSLPDEVHPHLVIDHHPMRKETRSAGFTDIRSRYGAASTILYEYLREVGLKPDAHLATALVYGIQSDTHDLGERATRADTDAFLDLYGPANKRALSEIAHGAVPSEYFVVLSQALQEVRLFGHCLVTHLGPVENPDMIAEMADLILRHECAQWAMCTGLSEKDLMLSIRSSHTRLNAGQIAQKIVSGLGKGGGHQNTGGGRIPCMDPSQAGRKRLEAELGARFLSAVGSKTKKPRKLIP